MGCPRPFSIKICGLTQVEQAIEIAKIGADAIGVIGVESSKRFVKEKQRRLIFSALEKFSPNTSRVWVIADLNYKQIDSALKGIGTPTVIQLHGHESELICKDLKNKQRKILFWKALRIKEERDLSLIKKYANIVDAILLDAWSPAELGGTGNRIDTRLIQNININYPLWLAGGISADCIKEIIRTIHPFGFDASSKLEIKPGIKDIQLVKELIEEIKIL